MTTDEQARESFRVRCESAPLAIPIDLSEDEMEVLYSSDRPEQGHVEPVEWMHLSLQKVGLWR